jgi:hypothetical protein
VFHLSSLETTNTELAAALAAVGIPMDPICPIRILTGAGGDRHCFFFQEKSPCGNYKTDDLIRAWNDPDWHRTHPEHPFAYVKVAFKNKHGLVDYVKRGVPTFVAEKHGKIAFIPLSASSDLEQKVFKKLNHPR